MNVRRSEKKQKELIQQIISSTGLLVGFGGLLGLELYNAVVQEKIESKIFCLRMAFYTCPVIFFNIMHLTNEIKSYSQNKSLFFQEKKYTENEIMINNLNTNNKVKAEHLFKKLEDLDEHQLAKLKEIFNYSKLEKKYLCPISWMLITDPVVLKVVARTNDPTSYDLYERASILKWLENDIKMTISPASQRKILKDHDDDLVIVEPYSDVEEYGNLLNSLEHALNQLRPDTPSLSPRITP